jgi:hypothetical protein
LYAAQLHEATVCNRTDWLRLKEVRCVGLRRVRRRWREKNKEGGVELLIEMVMAMANADGDGMGEELILAII